MAEFYKAHATVDGVRGEFTPKERLHFTKVSLLHACSRSVLQSILLQSADFYQQALTFLGDRKSCSEVEVWDNIAWDLSSTLFEMASQMQEHAPLSTISQEEVRRFDFILTQWLLKISIQAFLCNLAGGERCCYDFWEGPPDLWSAWEFCKGCFECLQSCLHSPSLGFTKPQCLPKSGLVPIRVIQNFRTSL